MLRLSLFWYENIKQKEDYYRKQSLKGNHIKDWSTFFTRFQKGEPEEYEYFIVTFYSKEDKEAYKKKYYEKGFEYICCKYNKIVFRKKSNTINEDDILLRQEEYTHCATFNIVVFALSILVLIFHLIRGFSAFSDYDLYVYSFDFAVIVLLSEECIFSFLEHRKNSSFHLAKNKKQHIVIVRLIQIASIISAFVLYCLIFE